MVWRRYSYRRWKQRFSWDATRIPITHELIVIALISSEPETTFPEYFSRREREIVLKSSYSTRPSGSTTAIICSIAHATSSAFVKVIVPYSSVGGALLLIPLSSSLSSLDSLLFGGSSTIQVFRDTLMSVVHISSNGINNPSMSLNWNQVTRQ